MWDKGKQKSHCLYTMCLLVALLGEFPENALKTASNVYLLKTCASLENALLNIVASCGIASLTRGQFTQADDCTVIVFNDAIDKSLERKIATERNKHNLYSWLLAWQCGLWAFDDCITQCDEFTKKRALVWKSLKRSLEAVGSYIESYEKDFPNLQDDAWQLYESSFLEFSKDKRFVRIK